MVLQVPFPTLHPVEDRRVHGDGDVAAIPGVSAAAEVEHAQAVTVQVVIALVEVTVDEAEVVPPARQTGKLAAVMLDPAEDPTLRGRDDAPGQRHQARAGPAIT